MSYRRRRSSVTRLFNCSTCLSLRQGVTAARRTPRSDTHTIPAASRPCGRTRSHFPLVSVALMSLIWWSTLTSFTIASKPASPVDACFANCRSDLVSGLSNARASSVVPRLTLPCDIAAHRAQVESGNALRLHGKPSARRNCYCCGCSTYCHCYCYCYCCGYRRHWHRLVVVIVVGDSKNQTVLSQRSKINNIKSRIQNPEIQIQSQKSTIQSLDSRTSYPK